MDVSSHVSRAASTYALPMTSANTRSKAKLFFALQGQTYESLKTYLKKENADTSFDGLSSTHRPTASACHFSIFSAISIFNAPSSSRMGSSADLSGSRAV